MTETQPYDIILMVHIKSLPHLLPFLPPLPLPPPPFLQSSASYLPPSLSESLPYSFPHHRLRPLPPLHPTSLPSTLSLPLSTSTHSSLSIIRRNMCHLCLPLSFCFVFHSNLFEPLLSCCTTLASEPSSSVSSYSASKLASTELYIVHCHQAQTLWPSTCALGLQDCNMPIMDGWQANTDYVHVLNTAASIGRVLEGLFSLTRKIVQTECQMVLTIYLCPDGPKTQPLLPHTTPILPHFCCSCPRRPILSGASLGPTRTHQ